MAATKDTFEPKTFAANAFAAGAFRGAGVDQQQVVSYGWLEYTVEGRMHYTTEGRIHYGNTPEDRQ